MPEEITKETILTAVEYEMRRSASKAREDTSAKQSADLAARSSPVGPAVAAGGVLGFLGWLATRGR